MPDKKQSTRVICEGGLDSTQNYLNLSANKPGCATRLVNYEVGLSGGYRRINGYTDYDPSFTAVGDGTAEGKVLGVIIFENTITGINEIIAARKDIGVNEYTFYRHEFGTGWVAISTGLTHSYILGGATVDKLRYDIGNDGSQNYLAIVDGVNNALLYDGTTWSYVDSANTGADLANAGGNQVVDAPAIVAFFSGSLFLAGDIVNAATGVLTYSAPNAFYDFTVASGGGQAIAGYNVVQIKPFRDNLYIFGYNAIKRAIADTTSGFLVKDVTTNIGCLSRDGVIELGGDLLFIAPDGFRPISGTDKIGDVQLETVSKQIQSLVSTRVVGNVGFEVNTYVIRGKSQFRILFGGDNFAASDSKGIIGALRSADQQNGWEFGELLGFRASCATSRYVNGIELVLRGDYDGRVYRDEQGNSLNGSNMLSVYSTPYLDLGDTEVRKTIEKVTVFVNGEGSLGISMGVQYDWGSDKVVNPANYPIIISGTIPIYDSPSAVYGDLATVYGGVLTPKAVENVQGSFFSIRLTFSTSGTEFPHSIHGLIFEYAVDGRI